MDSIYEAHRVIGEREHERAYDKVWSRKSRIYKELTEGEFNGMVMMNNYCLLKILREDLDFMETGSGVQMSTYYNQNKWAPTLCEVVKLPDELVVSRGDMMVDMEWETDIEVTEGDRVVVRYLPVVQALGMGDTFGVQKTFRYKDDLFILVGYHDLIVRLRDNGWGYKIPVEGGGEKVLWPLNGYVINEPVGSEAWNNSEMDVGFVKSGKFGRVHFVGGRIRGYAHAYCPDDDKVEPGQMMLFTRNGDSELMRGHLNMLGKDFRRVPKRHCLCAVEVDGEPMKDSDLWE